MRNKPTQEDFVRKELLNMRQISRNYCLKNYITRLGAIICDLNKNGWKIEGRFVKTEWGKDYVYTLIDSPFTKVEYRVKGELVSSGFVKKVN